MQNFTEFIEDLKTLISYKSYLSAPEKNAPFGKEVASALNYFLNRAKEMGFKTVNYDNYAGEVVFGEGEEIGIIGHLDVVPVGHGWNTDPFTLTKIDDKFYARGIQDDKSPLLLCLYALNELKNSKIKPNKKFRLFVGTNEESGWQDVEYLKTKTTIPEYGFSPDGDFPVSYAEKGITEVIFSFPALKNFHSLSGGTVLNAVCDYARCVATDKGINLPLIKKRGLTLTDGNIIESRGKAAHGSAPHLGKNALKPLFNYFLDMGEDVKNVVEYLFNDKAGVSKIKTEQGFVTFSPDLLSEKDGKIFISCDCRIPAPKTIEGLSPIFSSFGLAVDFYTRHEPVLVEKEGWFVQALTGAYASVTGATAEPISLSGSTFSRAFKKGCAFGPSFKGSVDNIHDANEGVSEKDLLTAYEIYKKAIFDISQL